MIVKGNLDKERLKNPERKGWFIGHFREDDSVFKNNDFEVKWMPCKKGEKKGFVRSTSKAKTIVILVKGKFVMKFPKEKKEIVLSEAGDFCFCDSGVHHDHESLEESIILTIKWPSVKGDSFVVEE